MECGFPLVPLFYADEVVAILEVDFVEEFRPSNAFLKLIRIRKGVAVRNCYSVDYSVVHAQA